MAHLSPSTLTRSEQEAILRITERNPRDHLIYSLALGTGLRLAEIVGLDVGNVFAPEGTPRTRIRIRREIAKGGRAGDVFLPDALTAKHHRQALCAVATRLMNRVYAVLKEGRPYVLRDLEGRPMTLPQAEELIQAQFQVPALVRERRSKKHRAA